MILALLKIFFAFYFKDNQYSESLAVGFPRSNFKSVSKSEINTALKQKSPNLTIRAFIVRGAAGNRTLVQRR